jgi:hypothetical protein
MAKKRKSHDNNKARLTLPERIRAMEVEIYDAQGGGPIITNVGAEIIAKHFRAHARATLDRAKRRAK